MRTALSFDQISMDWSYVLCQAREWRVGRLFFASDIFEARIENKN
jgi:hypothetical protein